VDNLLVSVIIPVHNGERYLADAIESVLAQTYRPIQLVVVDDGSEDGTAEIAKSFREVTYIYQTNQGHAAAMNAGIRAAQGEFVAFLDADDLWTPNKLSVQIDHLQKHPDVGCVIAKMQNFVEPGTEPPSRITRDLSLSAYAALQVGALVARRTVFEQLGGFDTTYDHAKDVDWFVRATEAGIIMAILPEILLHRRLHGSNRTYDTQARTLDFMLVLKSSINRKRQQRSENEGAKD
jgi:glycosyltransferase involved in cell wall biosynthesis